MAYNLKSHQAKTAKRYADQLQYQSSGTRATTKGYEGGRTEEQSHILKRKSHAQAIYQSRL